MYALGDRRWLVYQVLAFVGSVILLAYSTGVLSPLTAVLSIAQVHTSQAAEVLDPSITLTREDATNSTAYNGIFASSVTSQAELVAYAKTLLGDDARIHYIQLGTHSVSMTYASTLSSPIFGDLVIERTATVKDDGTVKVTWPWFASSFAGKPDEVSVINGFKDIQLESDEAGMTPETQARVLKRMQGRFIVGKL